MTPSPSPSPSLAFTSQIRWYKPSTPPGDGTQIVAIVQTETTIQLQPVIYYADASNTDGPLWVVNQGCDAGDEYETSEVIAWADDSEVAEIACKIASNLPKGHSNGGSAPGSEARCLAARRNDQSS